MSSRPVIVKVILCGESGVGKSALLASYLRTHHHHQQTIGVEFGSQTLRAQGGAEFNLMLWDTGGEPVLRSLARSYMRNVAVAVLVFDVGNRRSFEALLQSWMPEMDERRGSTPPVIVLVGNKVDDEARRAVTRAEAEELTKTLARCPPCRRSLAWQALVPAPTAPPEAAACTACAQHRAAAEVVYMETSASTGQGVDAAFQQCVDLIERRLQAGRDPGPGVVVPRVKGEEGSRAATGGGGPPGGCCCIVA